MQVKYLGVCLLASLFLLTGCQTSMLKQFDSIAMGMEKDDVLELMGSPRDVQRFHGKDRWKYVFYEDKVRFSKEVHFLEGTVIYVGEIWQPPTEQSAAYVDQKNAEAEVYLQSQAEKQKQEYNSTQKFESYSSEIKGEDNKIRYLPEFEAIR